MILTGFLGFSVRLWNVPVATNMELGGSTENSVKVVHSHVLVIIIIMLDKFLFFFFRSY